MCELKSMILLKDRVYCPAETDSHSDMIEALKIKDDKPIADFVKIEITPFEDDIFSDLTKWNFRVDQDNTPDWYVKEIDEQRTRAALKKWADEHIFIGKNDIELKGGGWFYLKNCKDVEAYDSSTVEAYNNSTVKAWGNSTVKAYDSSTVEAYNNSTVKAYDSSTVEAYDSSTVEAYDSSTVKAYDSSTVEAYNSSTVKAYNSSTVEAYDSSTVEAYDSSTVEAYNSSTVKAYNSSTVEAYNNSTVKAYDNSTVEAWGSSTVITTEYSYSDIDKFVIMDNSTLKDCRTKTIYQSGDWKFVKVEKK